MFGDILRVSPILCLTRGTPTLGRKRQDISGRKWKLVSLHVTLYAITFDVLLVHTPELARCLAEEVVLTRVVLSQVAVVHKFMAPLEVALPPRVWLRC